MIIENTSILPSVSGLQFILVIGFIGGLIKGVLGVGKTILGAVGGGGTKTSSTANYDKFLRDQAQSQREHEQRMAQIAMAQQKKSALPILPIAVIGGVAIMAMVFLPQMMGRRR